MRTIRIGLIGDYNAEVTAHQAIPKALELAALALGNCKVEPRWVATDTLLPLSEVQKKLAGFDGLWCVPASPYASMEGALGAIRFAREQCVPFLGTCGGFQHAVLEYARHVLGLTDAEHEESNPTAKLPLVSRLTCSLVEQQGQIILQEGSRIRRIYGSPMITEGYRCKFGLNPAYESLFDGGALRFTGREPGGEVRVCEMEEHPFFICTLFQPERSALRGEVHPLIYAFVHAAVHAHVA